MRDIQQRSQRFIDGLFGPENRCDIRLEKDQIAPASIGLEMPSPNASPEVFPPIFRPQLIAFNLLHKFSSPAWSSGAN
jgi:hypothetical protein